MKGLSWDWAVGCPFRVLGPDGAVLLETENRPRISAYLAEERHLLYQELGRMQALAEVRGDVPPARYEALQAWSEDKKRTDLQALLQGMLP